MVERKAARGPLTMSSGTGRWGRGADKDVHMYAETCKTCTILATLTHTTRLGSSEVYDDLCNFCANSLASMHRVTLTGRSYETLGRSWPADDCGVPAGRGWARSAGR